jgi:predicted metal-dependent phosphoesterase TrpH
MKIDLHVHTDYSDGLHSPKQMLKAARKNGLDGIAICDHNTAKGYKALKSVIDPKKDPVLIPGIEYSSTKGHIVGLGVTANIRTDLEPREVVDAIIDLGGVVVIPHPGKSPSGIPFKIIDLLEFDGIEVYNGRSLKCHNEKAEEFAKSKKAARLGGSDAHMMNQVGGAYTIFKTRSRDPEDLFEDIYKRKTKAGGKGITFPEYMSDNFRILKNYAARGFKRI